MTSHEPDGKAETYTHYGQTYNVYNREKLYQEVWAELMTTVAKRYQVSDVALRKVCKSMDIPTPPVGYWMKLQAGKAAEKPSLPESDKPTQKTGLRTGLKALEEDSRALLERLDEDKKTAVLSVAQQVVMPNNNAKLHPNIVAHRNLVLEWHKQNPWYQNVAQSSRRDLPFLADSVALESLPRVCRIMDALVKALIPLGCTITDDLHFVIDGEKVSCSFTESRDKIAHVPTKEENMQLLKYEEEKRRYRYASKPNIRKYDYPYNGRIRLLIYGDKEFRDCKSYVLEDKLGDIILALYGAAMIVREKRLAWEAEQRRKEEERQRRLEREKRYNEEVDHVTALVNQAEDYDIACKLRHYIAAISQAEPLSEDTLKWLEWASMKADWFDPNVARDDEFFGIRKHEIDSERKVLRHQRSW